MCGKKRLWVIMVSSLTNDVRTSNFKRYLWEVCVGIIFWVIAFVMIGYTYQSAPQWYLPSVIITFILFFFATIVLLKVYLERYQMVERWLKESVLFGFIVMVFQFLLDILVLGVIFRLDLVDYFLHSTVLITYPSIILQSLVGGFVTYKLNEG